MTYPFGETVTLVRRVKAAPDRDGNDTFTTTRTALTNIAVWPSDGNGTSGNERTDARDTVITGLSISLPDGVDLSAIDAVEARGAVWEVVGDPQPYNSALTGWRPGTPIFLTKVTG